MVNTSATGGYLGPHEITSDDIDLDVTFQNMIVGITGLSPKLVRPRWQPETPVMPDHGIDWAAVGSVETDADFDPHIAHDPEGDGKDRLTRTEEIAVLVSFYGPNGGQYAKILRDSMHIRQNLEELNKHGIWFGFAGKILAVHEILNRYWYRRYDIRLTFRREVKRSFATLNLKSAVITTTVSQENIVSGWDGKTNIIVEE